MKRGVDQSVVNWHYEQKLRELEAERDSLKEGNRAAAKGLVDLTRRCVATEEARDRLQADFNDCNAERERWKKRAQEAEAK